MKFYSHYFTYCEYCSCFGRYPRHDRFNAVYIPNSAKSRSRRSGDGLSNVDTKATPFADNYDGDVHNLVENMRRLDGTLPPHDKYCPPVNLFSPPGTRKYWIRASTPAFGYLSCTTCYGVDGHWTQQKVLNDYFVMKGVKTLHCLDINSTTDLLELKFDDSDFEIGPTPTYNLKLKYPIRSVHPTQCLSIDSITKQLEFNINTDYLEFETNTKRTLNLN